MTQHTAVASDPTLYPCSQMGCEAASVIVTQTDSHPALWGHCGEHAPERVSLPIEVLRAWTA